ncbi:MAG: hypothetical protein ACXW5U_17230 [Thermoanaerobaculia bacterium]
MAHTSKPNTAITSYVRFRFCGVPFERTQVARLPSRITARPFAEMDINEGRARAKMYQPAGFRDSA